MRIHPISGISGDLTDRQTTGKLISLRTHPISGISGNLTNSHVSVGTGPISGISGNLTNSHVSVGTGPISGKPCLFVMPCNEPKGDLFLIKQNRNLRQLQ